jgi:hypothetical protein
MTRRLLWFVGLYVLGIAAVGGTAFLLRALLRLG